MKKNVLAFILVFLSIPLIFAQENTGAYVGKEVQNLVSAVSAANGGDYILLPSGRKYILTKEEIEILNGSFDFADLSSVSTEYMQDGTQIKSISEAHTAYIYPDGQSMHMLKTSISFTEFMQQHIEKNYFLGYYVDYAGDYHDARPNGSPRFYVFRACVEFYMISDGINDVEVANITAYNYKGDNFIMRYFSTDSDWIWGHVSGNYVRTGEVREIEFDVE